MKTVFPLLAAGIALSVSASVASAASSAVSTQHDAGMDSARIAQVGGINTATADQHHIALTQVGIEPFGAGKVADSAQSGSQNLSTVVQSGDGWRNSPKPAR